MCFYPYPILFLHFSFCCQVDLRWHCNYRNMHWFLFYQSTGKFQPIIPFPGVMGLTLSSTAHWSIVRVRAVALRWLPWCWGPRQGPPVLHVGQQAQLLTFKCVKAQDGILIHPAKVVLPVNSLICCFNNPFSFLPTLPRVGYRGDRTSISRHVFLPSLAYHEMCITFVWNVTPGHF